MRPAIRPIGKYERLAYERAERDRERWPYTSAAELPAECWDEDGNPTAFYFDAEAAERVVEFFRRFLRHHKGQWAGRPFVPEDWQAWGIREAFGWMRPDGTRRFRTFYDEECRKNGKSTKAAGLGLYLMMGDGEDGAEIYSAATKKDQAKIVFDTAVEMLKKSPDLLRHSRPFRNNIHCERLGAKFEPLGADSDTLDGLNPHGIVIDELHAHRDRHVLDVLVTGTGARLQPMTVIITTAGMYDPASIGWEMHDYAAKVLEGVIEDETFFAFIAAADDGDDWTDPAVWWKANPNLGISVSETYLRTQCDKALNQPSYQNTFRRYHVGQWVEQVTRWIVVEDWLKCPVELRSLEGLRCFGGLDLSSTTDLSAAVYLFPADDGFIDVRCRFWIPEEGILARSRRDRVPYDAWVRDGWVAVTPGSVIDYAFIRAAINEDANRYRLGAMGFDPYNATQLVGELEDEDGLPMVQVRQGYLSLSGPSKEFERLVRSGKFRHDGNPVLAWMIANVAIRTDPQGNIKPDKDRSTGRIDGVTAVINALHVMALGVEDEPVASIYETRSIWD